MTFTLHRYIFRELMRVFILATVALTVMLSLGSIFTNVHEYGVGPAQMMHLLGYFLPIILTFVLPMAALFSASLVYGRFASDNELDACRASGISMMTLVYPGFALAVIVSIANIVLSFHVMPAFVQRAEKSLHADAKQIVFRNIQRKGYYRGADGGYMLYADHADMETDTLRGVVIIEIDGLDIEKIITASSAKVDFISHSMFNKVQITARDTYQIDSAGNVVSFELLPVTKEFPPLLGDDVKFKKIGEIKEIVNDPMLFYPIARGAFDTYNQLTAELLAADLSSKTADANESFYKLFGSPSIVKIRADDYYVCDDKRVELSGNIVVIEYKTDTGKLYQTYKCSRAWLGIEGEDAASTVKLEMYNPRWDRIDGSHGRALRKVIRGLLLGETVTSQSRQFRRASTLDAGKLAQASLMDGNPGSVLKGLQSRLKIEIAKMLNEVKAETHSRLVFGTGCLPLILIGIGLGIIKKGGHLLSAFGVSSVPAAILIVGIMMGKNIIKNPGSQAISGVALMWTGMIILTVLAIVVYRKLLKH
ncbi:LptF/LptG family permease [Planctomycetota bacterium]